MIRINLLPWREARRKAQRQHLGVLGGMVAVLGLLIVGAVHLTIAGYIAVQSERNEFLKRENVRLDKEIEEIKKLKTEIAALSRRSSTPRRKRYTGRRAKTQRRSASGSRSRQNPAS